MTPPPLLNWPESTAVKRVVPDENPTNTEQGNRPGWALFGPALARDLNLSDSEWERIQKSVSLIEQSLREKWAMRATIETAEGVTSVMVPGSETEANEMRLSLVSMVEDTLNDHRKDLATEVVNHFQSKLLDFGTSGMLFNLERVSQDEFRIGQIRLSSWNEEKRREKFGVYSRMLISTEFGPLAPLLLSSQ